MSFKSLDSEAMRAARGLTDINIRPGESVLLLTSTDQDPSLNEALLAACEGAGAGDVMALALLPPSTGGSYRHPQMTRMLTIPGSCIRK